MNKDNNAVHVRKEQTNVLKFLPNAYTELQSPRVDISKPNHKANVPQDNNEYFKMYEIILLLQDKLQEDLEITEM